jgi:hypothetical protein
MSNSVSQQFNRAAKRSARLPRLRHPQKPALVKTPAPLAPPKLDAKLRGELVEMMFMLQASLRGLIVAKPYGDSRRYDFITDTSTGRLLWRVQVKSTTHRTGRGYIVNATSRRHSRDIYNSKQIDFLIAYVIPRNVWYIVPVAALTSTTFRVFPDGCRPGPRFALFEKYRAAWHLLGASATLPGFDQEPAPV